MVNVVGMLGLVAVVWMGSIGLRTQITAPKSTATPTPQPPTATVPTSTATLTPAPTATQVPPTPTETPIINTDPLASLTGYLVFAMSDGYYSHLFAYHPQTLPLTRLTADPWDDRQPSISPDGSKIAFSSRRNGYWDIYILDLTTKSLLRVTDTLQYDGSPTWSPDGQWLAYETYLDDNLEILLQFLGDLTQPPVRLTSNPAADYSPAWSPQGRQIAFVSTSSGNEEVWLAYLDQVEGRFMNLSQNSAISDRTPAWSSDGRLLAWSAYKDNIGALYIKDTIMTESRPRLIGGGQSPVWSPDNTALAGFLQSPGEVSLVGYRLENGKMILPPVLLPGAVSGADWAAAALPELLPENLPISDSPIPPVLFEKAITDSTESALGRFNLELIDDITVPYPFIQDNADESFEALRTETARQAGWDLLGELENAFLPITEPPHPGLVDEWLFTGRAFALLPSPVQAGWMAITRENFSGQTYWHIWIRARYQDGSQGEPLRGRVWSLDARASGDSHAYEQGGEDQPAPPGYWIDFTELASRFGWSPLPALSNWRTYYPAARFNQFVFSEGLDWDAAMEQIYPPEAVHEPTAIPTQALAASSQPIIVTTPLVDFDPSLDENPTPRPTWTPLP